MHEHTHTVYTQKHFLCTSRAPSAPVRQSADCWKTKTAFVSAERHEQDHEKKGRVKEERAAVNSSDCKNAGSTGWINSVQYKDA